MTTKFRSMLLAGSALPLLALASLAVAAEPRGIVLAQAGAEITPADPAAQERERRRNERRMRREGRSDERPASPSASAPAGAPAAAAAPADEERDRRRGERRRERRDGRPGEPSTPSTAQSAPATPPPVAAPAAQPAPAPTPAQATPPASPPAAAQPSVRTDEPDRRMRRTERREERDRRSGRPAARSEPTSPVPPAAAVPSTTAPATQSPTPPTGTAQAPAAPAPAAAAPAITQSTAPPPAAERERRPRRLGDLRGSRRESREDGRLVIREGGRTMIRDGDRTIIRYNEADRFRDRARDVSVQQRGRETVTTVVRPDGTRIVTVVDENGRLLRRSRIESGDCEVVIIDNRRTAMRGPRPFVHLPPPRVRIPRDRYVVAAGVAPPQVIYETLMAPPVEVVEEAYGLDEIRYSAPVRDRMPRIDIDTITFASGSWEVVPGEAAKLDVIAEGMLRAIRGNPAEVFLIEGHTDAVGSEIDNLSLSDRRAEQVAIVLTDRFGVPAENLTTQGYGEEFLKVPTQGPERQNRRVAIRRITPLLGGAPATAQR